MGGWEGAACPLAHLPAVVTVGEVVEVPIVKVARACGPWALLGAHLARVDTAVAQELAVGHGEGLADGLGDELGLARMGTVSLGVPCPSFCSPKS